VATDQQICTLRYIQQANLVMVKLFL